MDKDLIKRINELAKKKKTLGLNAEEQAEQKQLYAVYLAEIREQFDNTLDNVSIKQEDGSGCSVLIQPPKRKQKKIINQNNLYFISIIKNLGSILNAEYFLKLFNLNCVLNHKLITIFDKNRVDSIF